MDNVNETGAKRAGVRRDDAKRSEKRGKKNRKGPLAVLIVGIIALVIGVAVLLVNVLSKPGLRDAEYLVEVGSWVREAQPEIVWTFTEIGKGVVTNNAHINDYDFKWAIEGNVMKMEVDYLYPMEESFEYEVDQGARKFTTYRDGEKFKLEYVFVPLEEKAN